jgi:hypothetical protein
VSDRHDSFDRLGKEAIEQVDCASPTVLDIWLVP